MPRISLPWTRAPWIKSAAALLGAAFAYYVWRAATLSITTDEAFTATSFVTPPWLQILTTYDANHHFLHSYLCKLVTSVFGIAPFALRIPALLGAALYLWSAWRLTRTLCGDSPVMPALCALLAFHPGLVDYFSLARGYSLALGLLLYALAETNEQRWRRVSLALGLAVAANAVFILPAATWIAVTLLTRRLWNQADSLIAPGAVAAFILMIVPVTHATEANFYFGAGDFLTSMQTVFLYPLTLLLVLAAALYERGRLALTLALTLAGLAALHFAKGLPWPQGRTGVYLIPLAILLLGQASARWRWSALPLAAAAVFCLATLTPTYTREWQFDSNNREVFAYLQSHYPTTPIAAEPPLFNSLEYYRRLHAVTAMPPIVKLDPAHPAAVNILLAPNPQFRELTRFQPSGVLLAAPAK
ncbi:MAG TPA: hypothetical protein VGK29_20765 [Paludibaculum sp.]|jgi:hypothetical protein